MTLTDRYAEFDYTAGQLLNYFFAKDFAPKEVPSFKKWLEQNNILSLYIRARMCKSQNMNVALQ